jgi:hypothetical protein
MVAMKGELECRVREILLFFDVPSAAGSRGHISPVANLVGEDLGVALVRHYLKKHDGVRSRVLTRKGVPVTPTNGTGSGSRLDRWLLAEKSGERTLYQIEIKMWSATAIGGKECPLEAGEDFLRKYRQENWTRSWSSKDKSFRPSRRQGTIGVEKVHYTMELPSHIDDETGGLVPIPPSIRQAEVKPMLCFWRAVHPQGKGEPLFFQRLPSSAKGGFKGVWVFSMSNYLRSMPGRDPRLRLEMPAAARRIRWLQDLFEVC